MTRRLLALLSVLCAAAGFAVATQPAQASGGGSASGSGVTSGPPYDFTDAFYRANGIDPAALVGRRSGSDGISVTSTPPDANHRNVRSLFTLPAYDTSGNRWFFTVLADLGPTAFLDNGAGATAHQLADASVLYVFPTRDGDQTSVGNNRQADMLDLSGGYFSHDTLGLWIHTFVTWTPAAFNTPGGTKALADLAKRNGLGLDGTPIITSKSDIDSLARSGYVKLVNRAPGVTGRYFVCPVIKDPRHGAIAPDARLFTIRRSDGTPLPAEQQFVTDFDSLQKTGDYPR